MPASTTTTTSSSASSSRPRTIPKTWASTAHARKFGSSTRWPSSSSASASAAAAAKEAQLEALEAGLEYYDYTQPVTAALAPGEPFLVGRKQATDRVATEPDPHDGLPASNGPSMPTTPRLRPPAVAYTTDLAEATDLLHCLGTTGPFALDLEWNFSRTSGVAYKTALLQIGSPRLVLLLQLSAMRTLPRPLVALLLDPAAIKTGVAIRNDARKLQRDFGVAPRGLVELSAVARAVDPEAWRTRRGALISLRDLTRVYLGRRLRKDAVRTSDWTAVPLAAPQQRYAATDAVVSLELLRVLVARTAPDDVERLLAAARVDPPPASAEHYALGLFRTAPVPSLVRLAQTLALPPATLASHLSRAVADSPCPPLTPAEWTRLDAQLSLLGAQVDSIRHQIASVRRHSQSRTDGTAATRTDPTGSSGKETVPPRPTPSKDKRNGTVPRPPRPPLQPIERQVITISDSSDSDQQEGEVDVVEFSR